MSSILITSIGNGRFNEKTRKYENSEATYCIEKDCVNTPYIFHALTELRGYEKIIFVGTAGSNWSALYWFICEKNNVEVDLEYVYKLDELYKSQDRKDSDLYDVKELLNPLKDVFGEICADIIVLKYGLTDEENIMNFETLAQISEHINDGDKITFDITHSFRSLAIYELLAVSYLKETLGKNIALDFVSYGMFEIKNENNGKVPIVDLSVLIGMMDWLKAADEYKRSGTTTLLAELLEKDNLGLQLNKEAKIAITN